MPHKNRKTAGLASDISTVVGFNSTLDSLKVVISRKPGKIITKIALKFVKNLTSNVEKHF
jgi:hypothetical protein